LKITSVDIIKTCPRAAQGNKAWRPVFVRINTDAGLCGFGEIGLAYGKAHMAGVGQGIDFAKLIIGMDPMKSEAIWDKLHRKTFWGMSGGAVTFAGISGIDIALWDIKGKALNAPVHQLLGGKTNERLRCYASQIQLGWGSGGRRHVKPAEYAEATREAMAAGFDAVKVDPIGIDQDGEWMSWNTRGLLKRSQIRLAAARVEAIRDAGGEDLDIIIELHSLTDANTSIQLGRELERFNCFYFEEPTQPLNPALFTDIARNVRIPLAAGERMHSRWGFRPFLEDRSVRIIQPDLCNTGGITEGKKICDMAHVYDVGVQLHICGGPISTAAALQVEAVIPNFIIHEVHEYSLVQENIDLCSFDYRPVDGYIEVPDKPGIGQDLTDEAIKNAEVHTVE
jgi:L-alanine-DL-glutamate epimerase-like enolase superfamily enzyme